MVSQISLHWYHQRHRWFVSYKHILYALMYKEYLRKAQHIIIDTWNWTICGRFRQGYM